MIKHMDFKKMKRGIATLVALVVCMSASAQFGQEVTVFASKALCALLILFLVFETFLNGTAMLTLLSYSLKKSLNGLFTSRTSSSR